MPSRTQLTFYVALFVVSLTCFAFIANPRYYYFLNDDFIHIPLAAQKHFIRSGLIRPLSDFTLWLDYTLWQKNAYGYHLTNTLIHIANSVLVFFASRYLFSSFAEEQKGGVLKKSVLAATFFLMYAFHSESIFWIIGRGGSLCTLFFLLSLIFYLKNGKAVLDYSLCLCFFFIGLLAYETIWVFPLVVSAVHVLALKRNVRKVAGVWLVFVFYLLLRFGIAPVSSGDYQFGAFNEHDYFRLVYNCNTLLARCFLPPMQNSRLFFGAYISVAALFTFLCLKWRSDKLLFFLVACLLLSLLPVVALGIDTHDSESERFIYLASFFAVLFLVQLFSRLKEPLALLVFLVFLSAHAFLLYNAAESYRVGSAIARQSLECIPAQADFNMIYAVNMPEQYKGALIFRKGFAEAVSWINNTRFESVSIVTSKERSTGTPFFCLDNNDDSFSKKIQIDSLLNKYTIQRRVDDVVFFWDDARLNIIRLMPENVTPL